MNITPLRDQTIASSECKTIVQAFRYSYIVCIKKQVNVKLCIVQLAITLSKYSMYVTDEKCKKKRLTMYMYPTRISN